MATKHLSKVMSFFFYFGNINFYISTMIFNFTFLSILILARDKQISFFCSMVVFINLFSELGILWTPKKKGKGSDSTFKSNTKYLRDVLYRLIKLLLEKWAWKCFLSVLKVLKLADAYFAFNLRLQNRT